MPDKGEGYCLDFGGSRACCTLEKYTVGLGHRRLIVPSGTAVIATIVESVVGMDLDGVSMCELSWDLQGASPVLQTTDVGTTPESAKHEEKKSVEILLKALR